MSVIGLKVDVFAPVRIKELVAIEADEPLDELFERHIGVGRDLAASTAKMFGKVVGAQSQPCYDAKCSTTSAFLSPEEVRFGAGVDHSHVAVGGDDFCFE